jgi:hypothetical protein
MKKYVCGKCFEDNCIKDFIKENAVSKKCSYCEDISEEYIAADISEVANFIEAGLKSEYGDAAECLPWDSAEGGWQGTTYDTYDLLDEAELGIGHEELINDLIRLLPDNEWCEYDPFDEDKELMFNWERFSDQVKHQVRYVFFQIKTEQEDTNVFEKEEPLYKILYRIGELVKKFEIIKIITSGHGFFRARLHCNERFSTVAELGPPLIEQALYSNRFSPSGIPMFYGAFDVETVVDEVYDYPNKPECIVSVGKFENLHDLLFLDFTNLPPYPSIFNGSMCYERAPLQFLYSFIRESTKSIKKDGKEHIEYVPTQVVTEFFRHILTDSDGKHFDGLIYPSSKHNDGKCCVIFCSNEDCTENKKPLKLRYSGERQALLSLDTESIIYRNLP